MFSCRFCDLKTKDPKQLSTHHDLNHLNSFDGDDDNSCKPFKCGLCSAAFAQVIQQ
jgi:hypothetical protein